jgi:hypothetical protein
MIRLNVNASKKVPIPDTEFTSQQFGCALEVEVSDEKPEAISTRIKELYALVSAAIDEQIAATSVAAGQAAPAPAPAPAAPTNRVGAATAKPAANAAPRTGQAGRPGNGNGNGGNRRKATTATVAQQRAIYAICKALGFKPEDVIAEYNVADPRDLSVRDASAVIDFLKKQEQQHGPVSPHS